jgi:hypothetical protein
VVPVAGACEGASTQGLRRRRWDAVAAGSLEEQLVESSESHHRFMLNGASTESGPGPTCVFL